jgi:L,D-peptidoglycan transpeptidase YkuD (ErfK/YbiS/YcfS/YnhG family)
MNRKFLPLCIALQLLVPAVALQAQTSIAPVPGQAASPAAQSQVNSTARSYAFTTPASKTTALASAPAGEPIPDTAGGRLLALVGRTRVSTPGERELVLARDPAELTDPLNWAVTIYKSRHQLIVYYKGRIFRTYHAVFGRYPDPGPKLYEGDLHTPEGVYAIVGKYYNHRWRRFLKINYPNAVDHQHYIQAVDHGAVPDAHGRPAPLGGAIGIHGTDAPWLNRTDVNWTTGCISVDNDAILELDTLLPRETLVLIKP